MREKDQPREELKNLINKAKEGDPRAFGIIYDRFFEKIYRYIHLRVGNKAEAEDLTQTVFLKVYEALENYEIKEVSPLAYFFTAARNTVINFWRRKKEISLDETAPAIQNLRSESQDPERAAIDGENIKLAAEAVKTLTPDQQEIITLKFMSDLSNREISEIINKSEDAIRQLQLRALRSLRQYFKNSHDG